MLWKNKKIEEKLSPKSGEIAKLVFAFFLGGFMVILYLTDFGTSNLIPKTSYRQYQQLEKMVNTIEKHYYEEVDKKSLYENMKIGLFGRLEDGYSYYLGEDSYQNHVNSGEGIFFGYGILNIEYQEEFILIGDVMESSPAKEKGLKSGDKIVKLNGKKVQQLGTEKAELIMRDNVNTTIEIEVERDGEAQNISLSLTKAEIEEQSVNYQMMGDVGYIQLSQFISDTGEDFGLALDALISDGAKGIVLDLRDNGGGLFVSAIEVADKILPKSTITYTQTRSGKKKYFDATDDEVLNLPMIVLVNEGSASASELLSAAVKDNNAAKIYGTTTFGKGIVQETFKLKENTGFKLTTKQYYSPKGTKIHEVGVKPDVEIPQDSSIKAKSKEDIQLQRALEDIL